VGNATENLDEYPVRLDALPEFIEELRGLGFRIGVDRHLQARKLLLTLAARGELPQEPARLQNVLGPLFASTPDEQKEFGWHFERWLKTHTLEKPSAAKTTKALVSQGARALARGTWVGAALLFVGLLVMLYLTSAEPVEDPVVVPTPTRSLLPKPVPKVTPGESSLPIESTAPERVEAPIEVEPLERPKVTFPGEEPRYTYVPLTVLVLLSFLFWMEDRRRTIQAQDFLDRKMTRTDPGLESLNLQEDVSQLFLDPVLLNRTASQLRLHDKEDSLYLDLEGTIQRSVRNSGFFTPTYRKIPRVPEYLALVDRRSKQDHQTQNFDAILSALKDRGVFIDIYYFSEDPTFCQAQGEKGEWRRLPELASRYARHRLWVFAEPDVLFDSFREELREVCEVFQEWPHRFIFSPVPISDQGWREEVLRDAGFEVLGTDERSLARGYANSETAEEAEQGYDCALPFLPPWLLSNPDRWLDEEPPDPDEVVEGLMSLRQGLGNRLFDWLAACAIYPELRWELTLLLGDYVMEQPSREQMEALARLPWLRIGSMPGWLREALLQTLDDQDRERIASLLRAKIMTSEMEEGTSDLELEVAGDETTLWEEYRQRAQAEPGSPLQDRIFLSSSGSKLSFQLPKGVGKRLRKLFVERDEDRPIPQRGFLVSLFTGIAVGVYSGILLCYSEMLAAVFNVLCLLALVTARVASDQSRGVSKNRKWPSTSLLFVELLANTLVLTTFFFSMNLDGGDIEKIYSLYALASCIFALAHPLLLITPSTTKTVKKTAWRDRLIDMRLELTRGTKVLIAKISGKTRAVVIGLLFWPTALLFFAVLKTDWDWESVLVALFFLLISAIPLALIAIWLTAAGSLIRSRIWRPIRRPARWIAKRLPGTPQRKPLRPARLVLIAAVASAPLGFLWFPARFGQNVFWVLALCFLPLLAVEVLLKSEGFSEALKPTALNISTLFACGILVLVYGSRLRDFFLATSQALWLLEFTMGLPSLATLGAAGGFLVIVGLLGVTMNQLSSKPRVVLLGSFLALCLLPLSLGHALAPLSVDSELHFLGLKGNVRITRQTYGVFSCISLDEGYMEFYHAPTDSLLIAFPREYGSLVSADGERLITSLSNGEDGEEQELRVRQLSQPGKPRTAKVDVKERGYYDFRASTDGLILYFTRENSRVLDSMDLDAEPYLVEYRIETDKLALSPDGRFLADRNYSDTDGFLVFDLSSNRRAPLRLEGRDINSLAFSPSGRYLAAASSDGTVRIWDLEKPQQESQILWESPDSVDNIAYSPDGRYLAAGNEMRGWVRVWDMERPSVEPRSLKADGSGYGEGRLEFSPGGELLLRGGERSLTIWDMADLDSEPRTLTASKFAFSPNGKRLATVRFKDVGEPRKIGFWSVPELEAQESLTFSLPTSWTKFSELAFTPDGKGMVLNLKGIVLLWYLDPSQKLGWKDKFTRSTE
jgi:WD40 domain-containing protein